MQIHANPCESRATARWRENGNHPPSMENLKSGYTITFTSHGMSLSAKRYADGGSSDRVTITPMQTLSGSRVSWTDLTTPYCTDRRSDACAPHMYLRKDGLQHLRPYVMYLNYLPPHRKRIGFHRGPGASSHHKHDHHDGWPLDSPITIAAASPETHLPNLTPDRRFPARLRLKALCSSLQHLTSIPSPCPHHLLTVPGCQTLHTSPFLTWDRYARFRHCPTVHLPGHSPETMTFCARRRSQRFTHLPRPTSCCPTTRESPSAFFSGTTLNRTLRHHFPLPR